jgi:hypothetical protein
LGGEALKDGEAGDDDVIGFDALEPEPFAEVVDAGWQGVFEAVTSACFVTWSTPFGGRRSYGAGTLTWPEKESKRCIRFKAIFP